jgi:uncharacterized protein (TIGR00369 family)
VFLDEASVMATENAVIPYAVGVDINATHHRSAREGVVKGTATAVHLGRTSACYEVVITDEDGRRLCTSRITCALVPVKKES